MQPTQAETSQAQQWIAANFTLEDAAQSASAPPFSFLYQGRPAADQLPQWQRTAQSKRLDDRRTEHQVTYRDPATGLRVQCVVVEYHDYPAVEWLLSFKNEGDADTPILAEIQALDTRLPCPSQQCIFHYANGALCSPDDFAPQQRPLKPKSQVRLQPGGGRSSSEVLPFFNLETGAEGVVAAVGWTGEWAASVSYGEDDRVRLQAGMALTHFKLHPGEAVRSPRILLLFWQGDPLRGQNLLRRFLLAHHRPANADGPLTLPVVAGNWGGTPAAIHLHNIRQIVAHDLPLDYYWIDAEWFGEGPWWQNCGNWEANPQLYPQGFKPISDALHASGRKFLLWFEPERVCPNTPWYREHSDWLLKVGEAQSHWSWPHVTDMADPLWRFLESRRNQFQAGDALFDLGNPQARRFLTDFISGKITEFGIDCYRHDANIAPLEFWRQADAPDRQGISEIRWIEGLYAFWDELRQRHPHLLIDNCASGGRRIDLETIGRTTVFTRSDFMGTPVDRQDHSHGLFLWLPLQIGAPFRIAEDDLYTLRSCMAGGLEFKIPPGGDVAQEETLPEDYPFAAIKAQIRQYLDPGLSRFFEGDYYPLTEYSKAQDGWMVYQLDRPDLGEGLVVALKRPLSPFTEGRFQLRGLQAEARYEVTQRSTGETQALTGEALGQTGLSLRLAKQPDSALIHYRRGS